MSVNECSLQGVEGLTLKQMKPGECGFIQKVGGTGAIRRRMLEMGLIEGALVRFVYFYSLV